MVVRRKSVAPRARVLTEAATGAGYEALRFLSDQGLEHSPTNFALAWHLKTDRGGIPAMAVDAILMAGRTLTQADADRIMAADVARRKGAPVASDAHQDSLRHQTLRLADIAAGAATRSSDFGRDLSAGLFRLSGGAGSVEQIVAAMVQRTGAIEAQLTAASKEIEDLRQQVEMSRDDAHRDALTGLPNRRGALNELASRRTSRKGVVAMCDIDHFKAVNDRFGHGVGDRVLKAVAESLSESVGENTVARWGGEEFLVIIDGESVDGATRILDRARCDLAVRSFRIRTSEELLGSITMSIGAASLVGVKQCDAIEAADRMLYEAKRNGRNRIVTHLPEQS